MVNCRRFGSGFGETQIVCNYRIIRILILYNYPNNESVFVGSVLIAVQVKDCPWQIIWGLWD